MISTAETLGQETSLKTLLQDMCGVPSLEALKEDIQIEGVEPDSREISPGDLFLASFGQNHDAREYIDQAISKGAVAVLAESDSAWQGIAYRAAVPVISVDGLAARISEIAARFYGRPSEQLPVIGITGTNGKTSCSQFIAQALEQLGYTPGSLGTLGYGRVGALKESPLTTPDPVFTQSALRSMVDAGLDAVAMEVSSIGLHQKRVRAVSFDTAIFTNLTRDHLDYHESMDAYAQSKAELFQSAGLRHAIVNLDDAYALRMINAIAQDVEILTYSIGNKLASVYALGVELKERGYRMQVQTPLGAATVHGSLIGSFNISNVLATLALLVSFTQARNPVSLEKLVPVVESLSSVPGRMEIVPAEADITAVVDYAHTPDGLRSALHALKEHFEGRIWCVFGCGGNRDKGKRPMMGEIAEQLADRAIISDDNPRNEQGDEIVQHILSGMQSPENALVIRDRAEAIQYAVRHAETGDVVLIAGKGHENYQDIAGVRNLFSDIDKARLALQKRSGDSESSND